MHPGCFDLQCVEGGSSKVEWYLENITSGMRDKVRQGMLSSSNYIFIGIRYICMLVYPK